MKSTNLSRRSFLKTSASVSAASVIAPAGIFAAGNEAVKVALIGCGSRGTGAAEDCLNSNPGVELIAMADMFKDQLDGALGRLKQKFGNRIKVTPDSCFLGFDAYEKIMAIRDLDIVMLCTPPGFRPQMVRAAVEAGKNIFLEKPGAVDPVGVRSLMESHEMAVQKKLSIVVGTQQRWQPQYIEIIKRIHNGDLGPVVGGQAYWNWGHANWHYAKRKSEWSDMEWQIRCWPYFTWLSGDHIVEQHLHNMDILNWAIGSPPKSCIGMGGRQARTDPSYGNIYDHFTVEYEYEGGIRVMSMASQIEGSTSRVGERVVCAEGSTFTTRGSGIIEGKWKFEGEIYSGLVKEHAELIRSIKEGKPINDCKRIAESTMTVIMGRMSAYTGRQLSWKWAMNASKLDLRPEKYELGPLPVRPVAIPGKMPLV